MREIKILLIIIFFVGAGYYGVEPFAHKMMHKHPVAPDFEFSDLKEIKGNDKIKGKQLVTQNCTACHAISVEDIKAPMSSSDSAAAYGVTPPDLSYVGALYNPKYIANFIKHPAKSAKVDHKFKGNKVYPMPSYGWLGDKSIGNIVAYLKSIAPKEMSNKEVFTQACFRCHDIKYDKLVAKDRSSTTKYLGSTPPDLSMFIRSRGAEYIEAFLNHPQEMLPGTAMPRVGLNEKSQEKIIAYLESVGDSKKAQREMMGPYFIGYFLLLALFAYLWKRKIWSEVH